MLLFSKYCCFQKLEEQYRISCEKKSKEVDEFRLIAEKSKEQVAESKSKFDAEMEIQREKVLSLNQELGVKCVEMKELVCENLDKNEQIDSLTKSSSKLNF
jgi:hypothetical protein